jgi:hypothetical protein
LINTLTWWLLNHVRVQVDVLPLQRDHFSPAGAQYGRQPDVETHSGDAVQAAATIQTICSFVGGRG